MPRLRIEFDDQELNDERLREGLLGFISDNDSVRLVKTMGQLMRRGDLSFWLSPGLVRKLKAFAAERRADSGEGLLKVDDTLFVLWLQQGGSIEPELKWEKESLPNNGGIYKMLLRGGEHEESVHDRQGE